MEEKLTSKDISLIALQSGIQLLPYVGGAISTAIFETIHTKQGKRLESYYQELSEDIRNLSIRLSPFESHDKEKLVSLIEEINEKVARDYADQKRTYFKRFFINTLVTPTNDNYDRRKFFLNSLSDLTLLELELLAFLAQQKEQILIEDIQKQGVYQYEIIGAIGHLRTYGFVISKTVIFIMNGTRDTALNDAVSLSDFGHEFANFCIG